MEGVQGEEGGVDGSDKIMGQMTKIKWKGTSERTCGRGRGGRAPSFPLKDVFQGQLLGLAEQLDLGDEPGVGGGVFSVLLAVQQG